MKLCNFKGGCCYADWKDDQGNSIGFGEGCYKTIHDNCPHEELIDFVECPICKNDDLNRSKCDICYGEGYLPSSQLQMIESYGVLEYTNGGWQLHSIGCKTYNNAKETIERLTALYGTGKAEYKIVAVCKAD
ncbi:MAG: hypothetical protein WC942_07675, partial [Clostridia bacterium]|jgi:hypothetical protein